MLFYVHWYYHNIVLGRIGYFMMHKVEEKKTFQKDRNTAGVPGLPGIRVAKTHFPADKTEIRRKRPFYIKEARKRVMR